MQTALYCGTTERLRTHSRRSRELGYTVLSTRGYEVRPFMYSDSASRMVRAGERPSAAAAACRPVVLKGMGGFWVRDFFSTAVTVAVLAPLTREKAASASSFFLKRAVAWAVLKESDPSWESRPEMTQ